MNGLLSVKNWPLVAATNTTNRRNQEEHYSNLNFDDGDVRATTEPGHS